MKKLFLTLGVASMGVVAVANGATTIPIDMSTGRPVVEIEVNGSTPLRMILDTGAGGSVIDEKTAVDLGLEIIGEQKIGDPSGRNQQSTPVVALPDVRIGGVALGGLEAASLDFPTSLGHDRRPVDGVLSLRDLGRYLVTLNLAESSMRLTDGHLDAAAPNVVPLRTGKMGIPWIQILVGPVTMRAFLDTGNPGQLSLARDVARYLELDGPLEKVGEGRTVSSSFKIYAAPLSGTVTLAGHRLENPILHFDRLHHGTQANIGSGLLRHYVVTLDQGNGLVRFEPGRQGNPPQMALVSAVH